MREGVMVRVESSSKQNIAEENPGDRLSTLPDSILLHILSFLPTETTVQTVSLVSQRYRYLWKDLQVFHFSYNSCDSKSFKWFSDFVNGVFNLRSSRDIRKIHLHVLLLHGDSFAADSIHTWIRAAIGPCLQELTLLVCGLRIPIVDIPSTLFNCTNLVSLSLRGAFRLNVQHSSTRVLFPSLKILILDILDTSSIGSLDALLSGCPVLQTLEISHPPDSISKVCVPPSLKSFKFSGIVTCLYLEINAPGLQYLTITNYRETFISVVGNLQNVEAAYIDVFSPPGESESVNPLHNLLRALCGVKKLELLNLSTQSLFCAPVLDFPEFRYLHFLRIYLPSFNSNFLVNMLQNCPVLQDLIVIRDEEAPPEGTWELQSTKVPNCLVSHLTSIEIGMFREIQDELLELLEFAEYILLNGLILKTMLIVDIFELDLEEKNYILKRLCDIPRGSAMCQIEFI